MKGKLSKFLQKKKGGTTTDKKADAEQEAKPEEVKQTVAVKEEEKASEKPVKKDESSDEEEDDLEGKGVAYGKFTEVEQQDPKPEEEDDAKKNMGFNMEAEAQQTDQPKKQKKTASDISFGGKPSFGKKRAQNALEGFEDTFDDIDKVQSKKDRKAQNQTQAKQQPIQRNAAPISRQAPAASGPPSRPTFTGKIRIGGGDQSGTAATTNYDFANTYKSDATQEEQKGQDKPRQKKANFQDRGNLDQVEEHFAKQKAQQLDEDGFEVVGGGNDRKARRQQAQARQKQEDEDDDDGFKIVRNDDKKRGGAFAAMNQ